MAALAGEAILGIPDGEEVRFPYYPLALAVLVPAGAALLIFRLRAGGSGPAGRAAGPAWLGLLLVELWAMSWPMVQVCNENDLYKPSACVSFVIDAERGGPAPRGRVLDTCIKGTLGHAALGSGCPLGPVYGLEAVGGYNPLDVHRFRDYLQLMADNPESVRAFDWPFGHPILLSIPVRNKSLADLLGVRYLLQPRDPADQPDGHDPAPARLAPRPRRRRRPVVQLHGGRRRAVASLYGLAKPKRPAAGVRRAAGGPAAGSAGAC